LAASENATVTPALSMVYVAAVVAGVGLGSHETPSSSEYWNVATPRAPAATTRRSTVCCPIVPVAPVVVLGLTVSSGPPATALAAAPSSHE
jgi:hypothetical protein